MNATPLVGLTCPNCGGGLGAPSGADYLCTYCGHRSRPRAAAAPMARRSSQRAELERRTREAFLAHRAQNAWVCFGIAGLFTLIGVATIVVMAGSLRFAGLFWFLAAAGLGAIGFRYRRAGVREKQLRARGLAGRATVASYKDTSVVVDGNPKVDFVLRIELPDRAAYDVKHTDYVPNAAKLIEEGTALPVFVSPTDPNDVLVDWWAE